VCVDHSHSHSSIDSSTSQTSGYRLWLGLGLECALITVTDTITVIVIVTVASTTVPYRLQAIECLGYLISINHPSSPVCTVDQSAYVVHTRTCYCETCCSRLCIFSCVSNYRCPGQRRVLGVRLWIGVGQAVQTSLLAMSRPGQREKEEEYVTSQCQRAKKSR